MNIFHLASLVILADYVLSEAPVVETRLGNITGIQNSVTFRGITYNVSRFLGIPYAKPPVGTLRFRKPVPYGNFSDNNLTAKEFGNSCMQFDIMGNEPNISEDCLFLNIFVPDQAPDIRDGHAVMIYVHGGGTVAGSAKIYLADTLASFGNVIVVTINYRLWIFGFLNMNSESAPGNMGLWDQHMAFQWVSDNIDSFGGDPKRVTIFGQSAGSSCVSIQSIYPGNHGLFRGVITESGSFGSVAPVLSRNTNDKAKLMAEKLQCDSSSVDTILKCFQNTRAEVFVQTIGKTLQDNPVEGNELFLFTVTKDGVFLKRHAEDLLKDTEAKYEEVKFLRSLHVINGFSIDEGSLWVMNLPGAMEDNFNISRESLNSEHIPNMYKTIFNADAPESITDLIAHEYTDWRTPDDQVSILHQFSNMNGDLNMGVPAIEYTRLHANMHDSKSYLYHFVAALSGHVMSAPSWVQGAIHGDELPPLFGYQVPKYTKAMVVVPPESWELDLSERLMNYWTNFAKSGNPNGENGSSWPTYTLSSQEYLKIDRTDSVDQYLKAKETNFWREVLPPIVNAEKEECPSGPEPVSSAKSLKIHCWKMIFIISCAVVIGRF